MKERKEATCVGAKRSYSFSEEEEEEKKGSEGMPRNGKETLRREEGERIY